MNFYPLLLEAKQFPERNAVHQKIASSLGDKYAPHKNGYERFKNLKNVSLEEFRKDIEEAANELGYEVLQTQIIPPGRENPKALSDTYSTVHVKLKDPSQNDFGLILTPVSGKGKTSTDFKEGMVCFFFDSTEEYEPFNKDETAEEAYIPLLEKIIKEIEKDGISGLDPKATKENLEFLKNSLVDYDPGVLDSVYNAMSIGNYLKNHPDIGDWSIHRDKLFNDIKKAGKDASGYPEDKWCPMDVILVKRGREPEISNIIKEAKNEKSKELQLGKINGLFLDDLDSKNPASLIAAISLKEQKARAGNAKSYVDSIETPEGVEYNLTDEEKEWFGDNPKIKDEITKIRKKIKQEIAKDSDNIFVHKTKDQNIGKFGEGIEDKANYLGKYGSLKMLLFFIEEAVKNENVFIELASYGLSLGVNPTFFKLIGNNEGDPDKVEDHLEKFRREGGVELYHAPGSEYDDKIWIIDNNKASNVKLIYWVVFDSWVYVVSIYIRSNQPKSKIAQVIVEIEKFDKLKDLR